VARDIISDKQYWVQGSWFDGGTVKEKSITEGLDYSDNPSDYNELKVIEERFACSLEDKVCRVCAEGAIYLAADTIIDGSIAINSLNRSLGHINDDAYENAPPDDDDYWGEEQFEWPFELDNIQEINDQGSRNKAHKETLRAFDEGIAYLKKQQKVK